MKYKYVLFDLDGTLIDTNKLIIDSFKHTYKTHLNMDVEENEIIKYFGEPLITTLRRYSSDNADELFKTYIDFNESNHDSRVTLCCNIKECLEALRDKGIKLAVVTSKRAKLANRGLELLDIKQYFKVIVTADDTGEHKPNPAPVLKALELLGAEPEEALMVGDSVFDILCAHNAGVAAALVNWRAAEDYLYEEKPDFVVNDAMELVDLAIG